VSHCMLVLLICAVHINSMRSGTARRNTAGAAHSTVMLPSSHSHHRIL
jgi:hypothetical protein